MKPYINAHGHLIFLHGNAPLQLFFPQVLSHNRALPSKTQGKIFSCCRKCNCGQESPQWLYHAVYPHFFGNKSHTRLLGTAPSKAQRSVAARSCSCDFCPPRAPTAWTDQPFRADGERYEFSPPSVGINLGQVNCSLEAFLFPH